MDTLFSYLDSGLGERHFMLTALGIGLGSIAGAADCFFLPPATVDDSETQVTCFHLCCDYFIAAKTNDGR
jgi:hypothetical protein